ncbi:hypothetical protein COCSUDRAFT_39116 [Coccomyxa subellipsoidea C-169]|uniref:Uncharacterized protein n=1 Tax=Coccomyxa subellipsoidea (strain C-169) TaxID=574566 RepID=I0Z9Y0_COCSC|nr:hypothetical protein COCSUDRAFT_39116 [Coccomyxa subellipsoidea C-169]EIE27449.1 hypothetical protein COCSUDRAFT_39116 [Coccomyxa subellipsoidea C-169]|eukprot:XP_005651993.1 hypothetical protein COCSUDRAFT_39116 [Coccomyxa subellipsoidea C-169]
MGKGLDTCLVETVEDIEKQLDKIQELPESDSYPLFHLLPEVVQHYAKLLTLPNELKGFVVSRRSPEECLRLSKEVAIATYEGARRLLGDAEAVVCVPPPELLQEPEFKTRALWEGMAVLRPWDEIPADVLAMEPQIVPEEATKDGTLNDEQKEILQEVQALVDIAEFMHYWSRRGCTLELETEYQI